ncbi:MAG: matrixin family metalloprotease [Rhodothermales bacterium]
MKKTRSSTQITNINVQDIRDLTLKHIYQMLGFAFLVLIIGAFRPGLTVAQDCVDRPASWLSNDVVTYTIESMPSSDLVNDAAIRSAIQRSFDRWGNELHMTFNRVSSNGMLTLGFYADSDDPFNDSDFDGGSWENFGGSHTLGLATIGGTRIGFDDDEVWKTDHLGSDFETAIADLFGAFAMAADVDMVATHEIGHALGLCHSPNEADVMFASAKGVIDISSEDKRRARLLKGLPGRSTSAITALDNLLFLTDSRLHQINTSNGNFTHRGGQDGVGNWSEATAMTAHGNSLYAITDRLWHVNPQNGNWTHLGGQDGTGDWTGTKVMTAQGGHLYVIQGKKLWRVDPSNGNWTHLPGQDGVGDWSQAKAMTAHGNSLYIITNRLWKVNPANGNWTHLRGQDGTGNWTGTRAMTSHSNNLYVVQGESLWRVNPQNGNWQHLPGQGGSWASAGVMTAQGQSLFIVTDRIWRVNPINGNWSLL